MSVCFGFVLENVPTFASKIKIIMATNRTFTMLKPDAIENGYMGKILDMIIQAGFEIKAMKYTRLTTEQAQKFGAVVEYETVTKLIKPLDHSTIRPFL